MVEYIESKNISDFWLKKVPKIDTSPCIAWFPTSQEQLEAIFQGGRAADDLDSHDLGHHHKLDGRLRIFESRSCLVSMLQ